jgi:hypothetical protein
MLRRKRQGNQFKASQSKVNKTLSQKQNSKPKRDGDIAQVVEHWPNKCNALGSIPSTVFKKKKEKKEERKFDYESYGPEAWAYMESLRKHKRAAFCVWPQPASSQAA